MSIANDGDWLRGLAYVGSVLGFTPSDLSRAPHGAAAADAAGNSSSEFSVGLPIAEDTMAIAASVSTESATRADTNGDGNKLTPLEIAEANEIFNGKVSFSGSTGNSSGRGNVSALENVGHKFTTTATDALGNFGFASTALVSSPDTPARTPVATAPTVTIADGATVEIDGASAQSVTFTGTTGTLKLDHSLAFTGQVSGLAGSDALDLADVSYGANTTATFLGNTTGGTLTVTDGTHTANIALQGNYLSSTWTCPAMGMGAPSSLIRCLPTIGKPSKLVPAAGLPALISLQTTQWLSVPTPMVPISGMGRSGSSSLRQRVCRLHL